MPRPGSGSAHTRGPRHRFSALSACAAGCPGSRPLAVGTPEGREGLEEGAQKEAAGYQRRSWRPGRPDAPGSSQGLAAGAKSPILLMPPGQSPQLCCCFLSPQGSTLEQRQWAGAAGRVRAAKTDQGPPEGQGQLATDWLLLPQLPAESLKDAHGNVTHGSSPPIPGLRALSPKS